VQLPRGKQAGYPDRSSSRHCNRSESSDRDDAGEGPGSNQVGAGTHSALHVARDSDLRLCMHSAMRCFSCPKLCTWCDQRVWPV
jgi:hypothetical protein